MAIFERAITSLAGVEERLRRSLNLVGLQQIDFQPAVTPVVLVDDATRPGCQSYRGRRWTDSALVTLTAGALSARAWSPLVPMIIDEIIFSPRDNSALGVSDLDRWSANIQCAPPGTVPTFAVATNSGNFMELSTNNNSVTDRPGLLSANGATWLATSFVAENISGERTTLVRVPLNMYLTVGSFLATNFSGNNVGNQSIAITLRGRIF